MNQLKKWQNLFFFPLLRNNKFRCRNLCDIKQEGKLNPEQFALAMWLIAKKQSGKDPPAALTPDMVPPSMRPKVQNDVSSAVPTYFSTVLPAYCDNVGTREKCHNKQMSKKPLILQY